MIRIKKKTIDKMIWSLFFFIVIFYPPIVPHSNLVMAMISLVVLGLKYRVSAYRIYKECGMSRWIKSLFFLVTYLFILPMPISIIYNDIVNLSHYISLFNRFSVLIVTVVFCLLFFLCVIKYKRYDYRFAIEVLCGAGLIEAATAILAFLNPTIKNFFIELMRKNSSSHLYSNEWYITVRSYGFAGTLVDLFGIGIAVIAGIAFFYGVVENHKFIIYSLIISIASVLNARTGIIIYLLAIVFSFLYLIIKGHFKESFKLIVGIIILVLGSTIMIDLLSSNRATFDWVKSGYTSIISFFESGGIIEEDATLSKLFSNVFWELPDSFRMIIGTGHSKSSTAGYVNSDVGYINDIWFVGIVGCFILYGTLCSLALKSYRHITNIVLKFSIFYAVITFFVGNIKCTVMSYNPGSITIFCVLFLAQYYAKEIDIYKINEKDEEVKNNCS